ncbi:hypothetical protein BJY01DRAFT_224733 [Aspergillus pseudoustus]|uniref:Uncharacterized protein n=1 Tax=Aspergillus pseudoustus TaxID=1810923 RepID=A0ABR4J2G0_9EURO
MCRPQSQAQLCQTAFCAAHPAAVLGLYTAAGSRERRCVQKQTGHRDCKLRCCIGDPEAVCYYARQSCICESVMLDWFTRPIYHVDELLQQA